ncbi:hypothetical protein A0256_15775 [Mucilaginibacter sp. PAMC 26640]|nr:hypothetical protein A0256_15775 [Mucilaginibacter sp. PAMC 26640]
MKKIYLVSAIALSSLFVNKANAQISVHIGFNVPVRQVYAPAPAPVYGPVYNDSFDNSDDYYYLPDVEAYYSVPLNCYFYNDGNRWVRGQYLPGAYRNYDWRNARRFEIRGHRPYMNHDTYRGRWGGNDAHGNWGRRNNDYASRGNDRDYNRGDWGRNNNRGGGYGQPDRNQGVVGWRRDDRRGDFGQPGGDQSGGRGGRGGQTGGGQMPTQPTNGGGSQHGGWGGQNGGGQQQPGQPGNGGGNQHGGGRQDRGSFGGGQVAQNNGDRGGNRGGFNRPSRF